MSGGLGLDANYGTVPQILHVVIDGRMAVLAPPGDCDVFETPELNAEPGAYHLKTTSVC